MLRRWRRTALDDIYRQIPAVDCKGRCQDSCGPIAMSVAEAARIARRGYSIPPLADGLAALDRGEDWYCPALVEGRCRVYADRPTICRLWGATESMPCPHGCTPPDALSQADSHRLLRLAAQAGGGMAGEAGGGMTGTDPGPGGDPGPRPPGERSAAEGTGADPGPVG